MIQRRVGVRLLRDAAEGGNDADAAPRHRAENNVDNFLFDDPRGNNVGDVNAAAHNQHAHPAADNASAAMRADGGVAAHADDEEEDADAPAHVNNAAVNRNGGDDRPIHHHRLDDSYYFSMSAAALSLLLTLFAGALLSFSFDFTPLTSFSPRLFPPPLTVVGDVHPSPQCIDCSGGGCQAAPLPLPPFSSAPDANPNDNTPLVDGTVIITSSLSSSFTEFALFLSRSFTHGHRVAIGEESAPSVATVVEGEEGGGRSEVPSHVTAVDATTAHQHHPSQPTVSGCEYDGGGDTQTQALDPPSMAAPAAAMPSSAPISANVSSGIDGEGQNVFVDDLLPPAVDADVDSDRHDAILIHENMLAGNGGREAEEGKSWANVEHENVFMGDGDREAQKRKRWAHIERVVDKIGRRLRSKLKRFGLGIKRRL